MAKSSFGESQLLYKDIESALAVLHDVVNTELPAFRAQLRHFRNIGIPKLPSVGSGNRIEYSADHVHQIFLALELHAVAPPAAIATFINKEWRQLGPIICNARQDERDCVLLVGSIAPADEPARLFFVGAPFVDDEDRAAAAASIFQSERNKRPMIVVFLKQRLRELDRALNAALRSRLYLEALKTKKKA